MFHFLKAVSYNSNQENIYREGRLWIRKGTRYDAHHIITLKLGGKNEVENIVPIHRQNHIGKEEGIHRANSPCKELIAFIEENTESVK